MWTRNLLRFYDIISPLIIRFVIIIFITLLIVVRITALSIYGNIVSTSFVFILRQLVFQMVRDDYRKSIVMKPSISKLLDFLSLGLLLFFYFFIFLFLFLVLHILNIIIIITFGFLVSLFNILGHNYILILEKREWCIKTFLVLIIIVE